jgi:hypothetical protein
VSLHSETLPTPLLPAILSDAFGAIPLLATPEDEEEEDEDEDEDSDDDEEDDESEDDEEE